MSRSDRVLRLQYNLTVEDYEVRCGRRSNAFTPKPGSMVAGESFRSRYRRGLSGYPHRIRALERILGKRYWIGAVWPETGKEIVGVFKKQMPTS